VAAFWDRLGADDAAALRALATTRRFASGQALMHEGQVPSEVMVLLHGRVKVSTATTAGHSVLLAFCGAGDVLGDLAALDEAPRSASVVALEPVEALAVAHARFVGLLEERPRVAMALVRDLGARLRRADAKRLQLGAYTTTGRVAFCLLELCDRFGEGEGTIDIALPISQEELAGWAGASVESVGRALQTMRKLGWVETRRRAIRVLDRAALEGVTR
jgi:CRP/FNR family cyclic AMP-dependent transcriptional regulator